MTDDIVILYTTWPDAQMAQAAASNMLERRLCACVNIGAPHTALYHWDGAIAQSTEVAALFKTTMAKAETLCDALQTAHPYNVPCILALDINSAGSNPAFLQWVADQV